MPALLALLSVVPPRGWLAIGGLVVLVGGGFWLADRIEQRGAEQAVQKVEKANRTSEENANAGESDIRACGAGGGAWDRFERLCKRPGR